MRNDRDYENRSYQDPARDSYRSNQESRGYTSYRSGYNTDNYESRRNYNDSRVQDTNYDHAAATRSRGLANNRRYPSSSGKGDYLGGRNFAKGYRREGNLSREERGFNDRKRYMNRNQYRHEQNFRHPDTENLGNSGRYGRYEEQGRGRNFYGESREIDPNFRPERNRARYQQDNYYPTGRQEYYGEDVYERERSFEGDLSYSRNSLEDRQRNYNQPYEYGRNQYDRGTEPQPVKDKYSSSSLHYSGITSLGEGGARNRDRYQGSQYIGHQRSDRNFAGRGMGSSQRYRN